MLLRHWCPDSPDHSQRYFSFAFRLVDLPVNPIPGTRGFIAQLHQGSGPEDPIPFRMQWEYLCPQGTACRYYVTMGVRDSNGNFYEIGPAIPGIDPVRRGIAVPLNVWTRMLFWFNRPGTAVSEARVWLMDNPTGTWREFGYHSGEIGKSTAGCTNTFQWKVGIYSNDSDAITIDYDNVAYGKRWNNITKNRLIGYTKSVLWLRLTHF